MDIKIKHIEKLFNFLKDNSRKKIGFFFAIIILFVLIFFMIPLEGLSTKSKFIMFTVCVLITGFVWLFISGRLVWPSKKLKVAIAVKPDTVESKQVLKKALTKTKNKLKKYDLLDRIKVFEIGTDICKTNKKAEKYLKSRKLNLVIHGYIERGTKNGKLIYSLKESFFSYYIPAIPNTRSMQYIKKDIKLILTHRGWIIKESNTLEDIERVSENFFEIILSTIAISSTFSKEHVKISITLLEKLLPLLEKKITEKDRKVKIDRNNKKIKMSINLLKSGRLKTILTNCYLNVADMHKLEENYDAAISDINKGLNNGADKFFCYEKLAFLYYKKGDINKAKLYTEKFNKIKEDTPEYFVNKAFLSIIDKKDYMESIKYYKKLRNKKLKNEFVEGIINFLKTEYQQMPKELGIKYGILIMEYNHLNTEDCEKRLLEFKDQLKDMDSYNCYVETIDKITNKKNE